MLVVTVMALMVAVLMEVMMVMIVMVGGRGGACGDMVSRVESCLMVIFSDVFYFWVPHKILLRPENRIVTSMTESCPIVDSTKRTCSRASVFGLTVPSKT